MLFRLDSLPSKELFNDVLLKLVSGNELMLNYFELKSQDVAIPFHKHPVEHLVIVLEGEVHFLFGDRKLSLKERDCLFLPAERRHSVRVIRAPVRALEIFTIAEDKYYEK